MHFLKNNYYIKNIKLKCFAIVFILLILYYIIINIFENNSLKMIFVIKKKFF